MARDGSAEASYSQGIMPMIADRWEKQSRLVKETIDAVLTWFCSSWTSTTGKAQVHMKIRRSIWSLGFSMQTVVVSSGK